jgi:hypothetical protein
MDRLVFCGAQGILAEGVGGGAGGWTRYNLSHSPGAGLFCGSCRGQAQAKAPHSVCTIVLMAPCGSLLRRLCRLWAVALSSLGGSTGRQQLSLLNNFDTIVEYLGRFLSSLAENFNKVSVYLAFILESLHTHSNCRIVLLQPTVR